MAGRNQHTFRPGERRGGRRKGTPNTRPSVVALIQAAVGEMPERERHEVITMIRKKIKAGDGRMWDLAAAYLDGKPVQRASVETPQQITFVIRPPEPKEFLGGDRARGGGPPSAVSG